MVKSSAESLLLIIKRTSSISRSRGGPARTRSGSSSILRDTVDDALVALALKRIRKVSSCCSSCRLTSANDSFPTRDACPGTDHLIG